MNDGVRRLVLGLLLALPVAAAAEPLADARALLAGYHEELARIDRARDLLEAEVRREPRAETLTLLARVWFLTGDLRAPTRDARLAAYDRGRAAGAQAIALAPRSEQAHVWYAITSGRWAEARGLVSAVKVIATIREELDTIFRLNPESVEGHTIAGGLAAELPRLLGGDRVKAEHHFKRALAADPGRTGVRVELARLYLASGRPGEARRELLRVLDETAPSDPPFWAVRDVPRARTLLSSLGEAESP